MGYYYENDLVSTFAVLCNYQKRRHAPLYRELGDATREDTTNDYSYLLLYNGITTNKYTGHF